MEACSFARSPTHLCCSPWITDIKTTDSQMTRAIIPTEKTETTEEENLFLLGIRYLKANNNSNFMTPKGIQKLGKSLLSFLEDNVLTQLFIIFFKFQSTGCFSFVFNSPIHFRTFCAFQFNNFAVFAGHERTFSQENAKSAPMLQLFSKIIKDCTLICSKGSIFRGFFKKILFSLFLNENLMYRELLLPINLLIKPASQQALKTKKFFKSCKKGCFIP